MAHLSHMTRADLVQRIHLLEHRLAHLEAIQPVYPTRADPRSRSGSMAIPPSEKPKRVRQQSTKKFDLSHYPTRKIALLVTYQGWDHGGLAWQPEQTPHPTIEGELFKAFLAARLVDLAEGFSEEDRAPFLESEKWRATVDLESWGYSRAGRTDAGVSGAGQVVSLWVRSNITDASVRQSIMESGNAPYGSFRDPEGSDRSTSSDNVPITKVGVLGAEPTNSSIIETVHENELPYTSIINSHLPDSIRVIAWSPVSPDFDARFSCQARHYKYFFYKFEASPFLKPLDIEAMRDGAQRLVGCHDFRNLCKLDKSKQIDNFKREIYSAEINLVDEKALGPEWISDSNFNKLSSSSRRNRKIEEEIENKNEMYVFDLKGSAFLYNQVRNIMAILFLIGSKLELPALIDGLLYTDSSSLKKPEGIGLSTGQFVDRKPEMGIASELPLVLWDCTYPKDSFNWKAEPLTKSNNNNNVLGAPSKTLELLRTQAARHRLKSVIASHQIYKLHSLHDHIPSCSKAEDSDLVLKKNESFGPGTGSACQVFGAGGNQWTKNYRSILNRARSISYSESNQKWLESQGAKIAEKRERKKSEL